MFEKDEDYRKARKESKDRITKVIKVWSAREETLHDEGFQKGAEFGYNKGKEEIKLLKETHRQSLKILTDQIEELHKANEWHYVKDGDLPKENQLVLLYRENSNGANVALTYWYKSYVKDKVIAWKEIVLPKEIKEND